MNPQTTPVEVEHRRAAATTRRGEVVASIAGIDDELRVGGDDADGAGAGGINVGRGDRGGRQGEFDRFAATESIHRLIRLRQSRDRLHRELAELDALLAILDEQLALLADRDVTDPQALVEAMRTDVPLALLPVRIETRFGRRDGSDVLLVRIVPDEIHGQTQGPDLDEDEKVLLTRFRADLAERGAVEARALLLDRATVQQAAWILVHDAGTEPPVTEQPAEAIGWLDLLPSRWVIDVRAKGETMHRVVTGPVTDAVRTAVLDPEQNKDGLTALWLRDFDEAVNVGMAVEIELGRDAMAAATAPPGPPPDPEMEPIDPLDPEHRPGLDIVVIGVDHRRDQESSADRLTRAFNGHLYGGGLNLLGRGTPTNNSGRRRAPTGRPPEDVLTDLVEPSTIADGVDHDAGRLERALGLSPGTLAGIARPRNRLLTDHIDGRAMARALWPITQGYSAAQITRVPPPYGHFTRYVSADGPLATLTVGTVPYGVVVTGHRDAVPSHDLGRRVWAATPFWSTKPWSRALSSTPTIGGGLGDAGSFVELANLEASSTGFRIRRAELTEQLSPSERFVPLVDGSIAALGSWSFLPILLFEADATTWTRGLVVDQSDEPVSPATYLGALASWFSTLRGGVSSVPDAATSSSSLLYVLLRYAASMTSIWAGDLPGESLPSTSPLLEHLDRVLGVQPAVAAGFGSLEAARDAFRPRALDPGASTIAAATGAAEGRLGVDPQVITEFDSDAGRDLLSGRDIQRRGDPSLPPTVESRFEPGLGAGIETHGRFGTEGVVGGDDLVRPDGFTPGAGGGGGFPDPPPGAGGGGGFPDPPPGGGGGLPDPPPGGGVPDLGGIDPGLLAPHMPSLPPPLFPDSVDTVEVSAEERASEFAEALDHLRGLDHDTIQRLLTETLDATHYRRDAWTTAIHLRQLEALRERRASGNYLGGYGFVLGLKRELPPVPLPSRRGGVTRPRDRVGTISTSPPPRVEQGGYLAAQTVDQAATLAVIRNSYLAHADDEATADLLRLNLSSARVRTALELIDGVREGNRPADVIGARFERLLHRRNAELLDDNITTPTDGLARHLPAFRAAFPNALSRGDAQLAADRVVDGVALTNAWRKTPRVKDLIGDAGPHRSELAHLLDQLEGQIDAANDLLLFEATFRATSGDPAAATTALDAHAGLTPPGEINSIRTPPRGPGFSHRLLIPFGALGDSGWTAPRHLRGQLVPDLDRWFGLLLGPSNSIRWGVRALDGSVTMFRLSDVALDAIDLVWSSESWARALTGAAAAPETLPLELAQHLLAAAREAGVQVDGPAAGTVLVDRADLALAEGEMALSQVAELALRLGRVARSARPLKPVDLAPAGETPEATWDSQEARTRIQTVIELVRSTAAELEAVISRLANAITALDATAGIDGAGVPADLPPDLDSDLAQLASRANLCGTRVDPRRPSTMTRPFLDTHLQALRQARTTLVGLATDADGGMVSAGNADDEATSAALTAIARGLGGRDLPFAPRLSLVEPAQLQSALGALQIDDDELEPWLQQVARVVPEVGELELALLLSRGLRPGLDLTPGVAQLPHVDGEPWIGGRLILDPESPLIATTGLCAFGPGTLAPVGVSGLAIGVITERIPDTDHEAGVAFRYDQPSARAPGAIALVVPPHSPDPPTHPGRPGTEDDTSTDEDGGPLRWRWTDVAGAVDTLVEDALLRAADPNHLQGIGPTLPLTLFPTSKSSTHFNIDLRAQANTGTVIEP